MATEITRFVAELLLSVSVVNQTAQVMWGLIIALEFLCLLLKTEASHSVLGYCYENAQSENKRSFKVGGCWSVLGLGLSPILRKQKQQVVLFRAGMFLLGQVPAVAGTFPVAFGPASSAFLVITSFMFPYGFSQVLASFQCNCSRRASTSLGSSSADVTLQGEGRAMPLSWELLAVPSRAGNPSCILVPFHWGWKQ